MSDKNVEYASKELIEEAIRLIHERYYELERRIGDLLSVYRQGNYLDIYEYTPCEIDFHGRIPVWICWWQGFENAPELVQMCHDSIYKRFDENDYQIVEITFENLKDYMDFPDWIWKKYELGIITMTQLSDILRAGLLYYYGGLWMDATYYLRDSIPVNELNNREIYSINLDSFEGIHITQGKWAMNFLYTKKGNLLPRFVLNAFYYYYAAFDECYDYFMIDYFSRIAYNYFEEVRDEIDILPPGQPDVFGLQEVLNEPYSRELIEKLTSLTYVFKLNYREELLKQTANGEETIFAHLLKE